MVFLRESPYEKLNKRRKGRGERKEEEKLTEICSLECHTLCDKGH
jgi:hypothetical protein